VPEALGGPLTVASGRWRAALHDQTGRPLPGRAPHCELPQVLLPLGAREDVPSGHPVKGAAQAPALDRAPAYGKPPRRNQAVPPQARPGAVGQGEFRQSELSFIFTLAHCLLVVVRLCVPAAWRSDILGQLVWQARAGFGHHAPQSTRANWLPNRLMAEHVVVVFHPP